MGESIERLYATGTGARTVTCYADPRVPCAQEPGGNRYDGPFTLKVAVKVAVKNFSYQVFRITGYCPA